MTVTLEKGKKYKKHDPPIYLLTRNSFNKLENGQALTNSHRSVYMQCFTVVEQQIGVQNQQQWQ
ncbi:hypothetical protein HanPI659440_Chr06g0233031 [Helianthus annuus]|nr:hypothetical protein HanPI659440_Chr06g0233031 [Helianthus annuus]